LKAQVLSDRKNGQILCTAYGKGKEHDFKLYKKSRVRIKKEVKCLADKGYQGIQNIIISVKYLKKNQEKLSCIHWIKKRIKT
jgi:hypothetical protein